MPTDTVMIGPEGTINCFSDTTALVFAACTTMYADSISYGILSHLEMFWTNMSFLTGMANSHICPGQISQS